MIALLDQADITETASAWRLGIPARVNTMRREETDAQMIRTGADTPITTFPAFVRAPGFRLVRERIMRLGGRFGPARGPGYDHPRTRITRDLGGAGATPIARAVQNMPAGLTPTASWWETTMLGSDVYAAV